MQEAVIILDGCKGTDVNVLLFFAGCRESSSLVPRQKYKWLNSWGKRFIVISTNLCCLANVLVTLNKRRPYD